MASLTHASGTVQGCKAFAPHSAIKTRSIGRPQPHRYQVQVQATPDNDSQPLLPFLTPETAAAMDTPVLTIVAPATVVLGILMLLDAAYSGDWSRIGAISKAQEQFLQGIVPVAVGGHAACAVAAGVISQRRGEEWGPRAVKTFFGGIVTLIEVAAVPEKKKTS